MPVAIETVEAGDLVWSRDEHTGEEGFKVVVETYIRETDELVHLSYTSSAGASPAPAAGASPAVAAGTASIQSGTDTLVGTAEHPFWSLTRDAWINMGELRVGERLSLTTGPATVTAVRVEVLSEPVKVYNFQVADWHTYYAAPDAGWSAAPRHSNQHNFRRAHRRHTANPAAVISAAPECRLAARVYFARFAAVCQNKL